MDNIISRINQVRNDMSVYAFAKHLGLKQASLDRYIKGQRKPSVELIYTICQRCDVSADWLLGLSKVSTQQDEWKIRALAAEEKLAALRSILS